MISQVPRGPASRRTARHCGRSAREWCPRSRMGSAPGRRAHRGSALRWSRAARSCWCPAAVGGTGSRDWLGSCGKTQLAAFFAESLWRSREVDLLVWVAATSRASVLAGYAEAARGRAGHRPQRRRRGHRRAAGELAGRDPAAVAGGARRPDRRGRPGRAVAGGASGPGPDHHASPAVTARRAPGPGPPGRRVQLPGGAELPDGPPHRRPGPAARRDRPRRGSRLRAHGARPGQRRHRQLVAVLPGLPGLLHGQAGPAGRDRGSKPPAAAVSWLFSVEQADRLAAGGAAQPVLALAALLDGDGMPATVFSTTAAGCLPRPGWRRPRQAARELAWNTLPILERTALLALDPSASPAVVRMNPVIQAAIRAVMPDSMRDRAVRAAADALVEAWPAEEPTWLATMLRSCAASLQQTRREHAAGRRLPSAAAARRAEPGPGPADRLGRRVLA